MILSMTYSYNLIYFPAWFVTPIWFLFDLKTLMFIFLKAKLIFIIYFYEVFSDFVLVGLIILFNW